MQTADTPPSNSEQMTRVGPGTVMGNLMRQYWIPALASKELSADGEPRRLMLLGEKLIAFRDSSGRVGVMDHRCPHRVASLFFGRNEQDGIRCVYHGWKFDVDGQCVEMPNVPAGESIKDRIKAKAYQTAVSMSEHGSEPFTLVAEDLVYPVPSGATADAYIFYIGFDPQSLKSQPKAVKAGKKP